MYIWLVAVLLLASAANSSRGQGAGGVRGEGVYLMYTYLFSPYTYPPTGAQVPITSYTCTQPNVATFLDQGQCTVSGGLRACAIKEGAHPALLSSSADLGVYAWDSNTNPFVVLDIPQGHLSHTC